MRVALPADVLIRELDGESVILNLNNGRYFGLDEVGTHMLGVLSTSNSIQAAFEALLSEYDVPSDRLRQDLHNLVERLVKHGLVEISSA
ncbi:MAG: PqqD family protein [Acidobacteria bacterium]|nr:PqqD family protein [Acidobacteriota bacterium]